MITTGARTFFGLDANLADFPSFLKVAKTQYHSSWYLVAIDAEQNYIVRLLPGT
jgi:hypothetical protein